PTGQGRWLSYSSAPTLTKKLMETDRTGSAPRLAQLRGDALEPGREVAHHREREVRKLPQEMEEDVLREHQAADRGLGAQAGGAPAAVQQGDLADQLVGDDGADHQRAVAGLDDDLDVAAHDHESRLADLALLD